MSIYKRGGLYSFNFWFHGRHVQGPTKTSNRKAARDIESAVRVKLARGEFDLDVVEKPDPTLGQLFDGLEQHFRRAKKWTLKQQSNLRVLRKAFPKDLKASALTENSVEAYIAKRERKHRAAATINRVTQLLGESYRLADVTPPCKIRHISEKGNARKGFFEADEFDRVLTHLPEDLKDFCRFAFWTGWRKNEIASLTWRDVEGDIVRLRDVNAKNENARSVPLNIGELAAIIERRRKLQRNRFKPEAEPVFHRGDGKKILEFRKSWKKACKAAGLTCTHTLANGRKKTVPNRLFHDFRRTAVRNMIRARVPQSIAMKISGHETDAMFRRYDIVDDSDLRSAMQSVASYHEMNAAKVTPIPASAGR